jgi:excisionase family DNA binding protein
MLLNVRETAARLNLKPWSVYKIVSAGLLSVHRTGPKGRTLRISESDLDDYLRRVRSPAPNGGGDGPAGSLNRGSETANARPR